VQHRDTVKEGLGIGSPIRWRGNAPAADQQTVEPAVGRGQGDHRGRPVGQVVVITRGVGQAPALLVAAHRAAIPGRDRACAKAQGGRQGAASVMPGIGVDRQLNHQA
jgi:hypothetical protein